MCGYLCILVEFGMPICAIARSNGGKVSSCFIQFHSTCCNLSKSCQVEVDKAEQVAEPLLSFAEAALAAGQAAAEATATPKATPGSGDLLERVASPRNKKKQNHGCIWEQHGFVVRSDMCVKAFGTL